jgi:hypothetical protein
VWLPGDAKNDSTSRNDDNLFGRFEVLSSIMGVYGRCLSVDQQAASFRISVNHDTIDTWMHIMSCIAKRHKILAANITLIIHGLYTTLPAPSNRYVCTSLIIACMGPFRTSI